MKSQRERIKERIEQQKREWQQTQSPDLGGENVPLDESLTEEGN